MNLVRGVIKTRLISTLVRRDFGDQKLKPFLPNLFYLSLTHTHVTHIADVKRCVLGRKRAKLAVTGVQLYLS